MKVDQRITLLKYRSHDVVDDKIYKIYMAKIKTEHEEPLPVRLVVLNNAKQRMSEFH